MQVLLISTKAMEPLTTGAEIWKADAEKRWADNVLLELRLARELEKQRQGQFKVFGLLLGDYAPCVEKGEDGKPTKPITLTKNCLLYTSPSPRDLSTSRMPSSA